jgi:FtsH-binding integral membrane protein
MSGERKDHPMSDFDRNYATLRGVGTDRAVAYDMGLRAHMIRVYNYMTSGVALTGVVAWFTYQMAVVTDAAGSITGLTPFGQALFGSPLMWVLVLAPLGLVFFLSFRIGHLQASTARLLFFVYAGLLGVSLASIFMVYTHASITRVFFISAAAFGALSLYGYTTQRSLDAMGSFLIMGLFGLIIASLVNIFLKSSGLDWALSVIGVLIFAGLTAWDTQKIKEMYDVNDDGTVTGRKAVMGALSLYLDFINMFMMLLRLFGDRR